MSEDKINTKIPYLRSTDARENRTPLLGKKRSELELQLGKKQHPLRVKH